MERVKQPVSEDVEHQMRLATGALLMEMVRADFEIKPEERQSIAETIKSSYGLTAEETRQLIQSATEESECSVSIRIYTSLLNEHATHHQKIKLINDLWATAYADGELHALEDNLVSRVADAIGIKHKDLEALRVAAVNQHPS